MSANDALLRESIQRALTEYDSIRGFVQFGAQLFEEHRIFLGHGTDNGVDEAFALVIGALDLAPDFPEEKVDATLADEQRVRIGEYFERRVLERLPAPYITGRAWFAGLDFYVDQRVLIPRSPLAEPIDNGLEPWIDPAYVRRILDIGTGSGCLAITAALSFPHATVDAVDVSAPALEVAAKNIAYHGVSDCVTLHQGSLFEPVAGPYDLILSNPPYVPRSSMAQLPAEYSHEPNLALEAGDDGLNIIRPMLAEAAQYLTPDGTMVVEFGESRAAFEAAYPKAEGVWLEFEHGGDDVLLMCREELVPFAKS